MIYEIENKNLTAILKDENMELPEYLNKKIEENFENIKKSGTNVWNGEVLCVAQNNVSDQSVELICKKSNYAHYLYGERIGCPAEYSCKNLSAGCLLETIDNYYIIGELASNTSYPTMLQVTGGGVDKNDIINGNINIMNTIIREALEELNVDLNNKNNVLYNKIKYMYISEENEQPGVQIFSKAKINMTAKEMQKYFEDYYTYLKDNNLEIEFGKLHFLKKETALEELSGLENPKRNYLFPLINADIKILNDL